MSVFGSPGFGLAVAFDLYPMEGDDRVLACPRCCWTPFCDWMRILTEFGNADQGDGSSLAWNQNFRCC